MYTVTYTNIPQFVANHINASIAAVKLTTHLAGKQFYAANIHHDISNWLTSIKNLNMQIRQESEAITEQL